MKENILIEKSIDFAARVIKLQRYLVKDKKSGFAAPPTAEVRSNIAFL